MASRNPSTNGPPPDHPPPPVAPTTLQKFLGIPTTTSVQFAFTLFAGVEVAAFALVRSGAVALVYPPQPLAVLLFICLFSFLFWHQRRCVRDLLTRTHPDCEAGLTPSAATGSVADAGPATATAEAEAKAEAAMSPEGEELWMLFTLLQTPFYAGMVSIMLITGCWLGVPGVTIALGALLSLVGFLWFLWVCCWEIRQSQDFLRERGRLLAERRVILELQEKLRECRERLEQRGQGHQSQEVEGSAAAPPSESREDVASSGGEEMRGLDLPRRRLSCIVEEEDDGPAETGCDTAETGADNPPPTPLVLSQQAQDLVWNRVRYLAAREMLRERRRKKLIVRPAMRELQGRSAPGGDGGFYVPPADSAQSSQEAGAEGRGRDRQGQGAGLRRVGEDRGGLSGGTRDDDRDTSGTFSSEQPSASTTTPTMDSNPIIPVPQQQQTFPATENPSHLPAAMDRTDAYQQRQGHIEAMTRLTHAKDSEIATLRTHMEGMTKYFRTREESYRAAHAAEVANAWRNAQVLFEKVGKLEGRLCAGSGSARKEVEEGEQEVGRGVGSTEQEERVGRKMGILAKEGKGEGWAGSGSDFVSRQQQQQQQEQDEVVEEENESDTQDVVTDFPLCQNTGCFCHFPVASPQPRQQQQQQRQEEAGSDENEVAIIPQDHIDGLDEDENNDDDDAFTIILESSTPPLPPAPPLAPPPPPPPPPLLLPRTDAPAL
ncbi:hypothetical protein KC360_g2491 [Hortaea werneckii]|nr:hypothetical protein KC325_g7366 [Hortaea werneckii]KAI6996442.1 hypothetical protein KC359_g3461 [Hortaea werneckii]KAI7147815.1 hypothetical protein KC344_g2523 [Hortaea werneckii]KAI7177217.1 hypothetical protein KC360_g2491 [Hortaea werneckii]